MISQNYIMICLKNDKLTMSKLYYYLSELYYFLNK